MFALIILSNVHLFISDSVVKINDRTIVVIKGSGEINVYFLPVNLMQVLSLHILQPILNHSLTHRCPETLEMINDGFVAQLNLVE